MLCTIDRNLLAPSQLWATDWSKMKILPVMRSGHLGAGELLVAPARYPHRDHKDSHCDDAKFAELVASKPAKDRQVREREKTLNEAQR
jgi:hypothetical protein